MTANPSLLPAPRAFSEREEELFLDLADAAEIDALVEALFSDEPVRTPQLKAQG